MTNDQRRVTFTIAVIVGLTLLLVTGLTFLVQPLGEDLALADAAIEQALVVPTIASLLMVFVAGRAGDQFGQRRTIVAAAFVFSVGAAILASAESEISVMIGLAMGGAGAIVIQVVAVSLLQRTAPDGKAHTAAFTTYGTVFPIAFLIFPITTAYLLTIMDWRWVPIIWSIAGVLIMALSILVLDREKPQGSSGEWASPILAGITLMAGTRVLDELGARPADGRLLAVGAALFLAASVGLVLVMTRVTNPGFSFRPITGPMMGPLMIGVALVTLIQIITYVSISIEYLYKMTPFEASLAIAPAQLGAIIGAKFVAGRTIKQWGVERSGRRLLLATGTVMLLLVGMQYTTPLWYLIVVSTLFSLTGMAALTTLNLDIMGRAPSHSTGAVSAFRTAASSVGSALSMAVLGVVVLSSVTMSDGVANADDQQLIELASALRLDGILGFVISVAGWVFLSLAARRSRAREGSLLR